MDVLVLQHHIHGKLTNRASISILCALTMSRVLHFSRPAARHTMPADHLLAA